MASPLEMTEMYDNALLGILQHVGNIQDFLRVYFGFLYRKTDFYRLLSGPNDRMGFPPGVAEKMVLKVKFPNALAAWRESPEQHSRIFIEQEAQIRDRQRERYCQLQNTEESRSVPPAVQELQVSSEPPKTEEEGDVEAPHLEGAAAAAAATARTVPHADNRHETLQASSSRGAQGDQAAAGDGNQDKFQSNPDTYNGARRENYSWSQDYTDVEVKVFVPKTVVRGRQSQSVEASVQSHKGTAMQSECLTKDGSRREENCGVGGEFTHKINTENSLWSLEPGKCVWSTKDLHVKEEELKSVSLAVDSSKLNWWTRGREGRSEFGIQTNRWRSWWTVDEVWTRFPARSSQGTTRSCEGRSSALPF
ncbi:hypothetical protein OJAV_G00123880 [Oryzias javanicus]|uniref:CS domain-containing protein n=1 Tax=Oryzias javanicus TaxID=123683 RepID=A0A437CVP7_ORYJA|nr:hypothetical protein OJAV_G00123880 [Oryzias javanicus]